MDFAILNVDRESGRDVKVKNETQMPLFSPASSAWFSIWVSPILRCTARRRRCLLAVLFDFSWLCCGFVIVEDAHGAKGSELGPYYS